MYRVLYEPTSDNSIGRVSSIINLVPETAHVVFTGYFLDTKNEAPAVDKTRIGYSGTLLVNTLTCEMYWEYVPIEPTLEEKITLMQQALDDLILGGGTV